MTEPTTDDTTPIITDNVSEGEKAERREFLQPLYDAVNSDDFTTTLATLSALRGKYIDEAMGFAHLHGVISIMPRLKEWVETEYNR